MSDEVVTIKVFNNEVDARMAQEVLQQVGVSAFVFKDDGGGMEPHLQRTLGVRLVVSQADSERAHQMLLPL
jgi:Putative prokaryotic signal transducing protein